MPEVGRFQVMALLRAARYYLFKWDLDRAKSFGLNRAVFYAWAKRSKGRPASRRVAGASASSMPSATRGMGLLGDEGAYVNEQGLFVIGDDAQRPEDYDREVTRRINSVIPCEKAWRAALSYLRSFPPEVLLNEREFFEKVYLPVRDRFEELVRRFGAD